MNPANTDIDIDFADRDNALVGLWHIPAMLTNKNGQISRHPSGVYFQDAPVNPLTGLCSFDYKLAEAVGYFKIDFLNQTVYQQVRDEEHLDALMAIDPPWELLDSPELVEQLPHINRHYDVVQAMQPRSIEDLAEVLAIVRPGKRYLLGAAKDRIKREIWRPVAADEDGEVGYTFKKAHAIAYAALVVVAFNLIVEQLSAEDDGISI